MKINKFVSGEIKSVSGIACYVKNLDRTVEFYEKLGFEFRKREPNHATAYVNWFWIDFLETDKENKEEFQKEANLPNKGAGMFIYNSVDDVDEFYQSLIDEGFKPSNKPRDFPWGNREFVLRDPDGYKLVFFKRK